MDAYESLKHTQWECLCRAAFTPKCRRRTLHVGLRRQAGKCFAGWRSSRSAGPWKTM